MIRWIDRGTSVRAGQYTNAQLLTLIDWQLRRHCMMQQSLQCMSKANVVTENTPNESQNEADSRIYLMDKDEPLRWLGKNIYTQQVRGSGLSYAALGSVRQAESNKEKGKAAGSAVEKALPRLRRR
jgi:hypothetical protein